MFALADTFDALTTDRPYRPASGVATAREIISAGSGTQFDPAIVEAFERITDSTLARIRQTVDPTAGPVTDEVDDPASVSPSRPSLVFVRPQSRLPRP